MRTFSVVFKASETGGIISSYHTAETIGTVLAAISESRRLDECQIVTVTDLGEELNLLDD